MASVWDPVGANASTSASSVPQDIMHEVNVFLQGATCQRKVPVDHLAQTALLLLQKMPAARHAVLEHFGNVFDDAAGAYISQIDTSQKQEEFDEAGQSKYAVLHDVTGVLHNFINTNPEAWAPIVSSWSLSLLGQISCKYAERRGMSLSNSLNEVLQLWMTCPPTKLLIELATECFAAMVGSSPDICVDALLEASVKYSPHFDWVVARIGSCFPTTIITRVLNCGLKDFCSVDKELPERDTGSRKKIPKMASVVGILGHLASKHRQDIRGALMALFEEGLQSDGDAMRVTTVPFLLQLASMSQMLLQVLTTDLVKALTPAVLNRLHNQFSAWKMSNPVEYNSFLNLVVHMLGKCNVGAFDILSFITVTAVPLQSALPTNERVVEAVQDTCLELIHMLLFELQRGVFGKRREALPLLDGLAQASDKLVPLLLQSVDSKRLPWLQKLLVFTAVHAGEASAASILATVISLASNSKQLSLYFYLQEAIEKNLPNIAHQTVSSLFGAIAMTEVSDLTRILCNFEHVILGEKKRTKMLNGVSSSLIETVQGELGKLCDVLLHPSVDISVCGLHLLSSIDIPATTNVSTLLRLSACVITLLFQMVWLGLDQQKGGARKEKQNSLSNAKKGIHLCQACLVQLGQHPFAQSFLLQHLLHGAISSSNSPLFGGKPDTTTLKAVNSTESSLLQENRRFGLSLPLPRTHASVFHAGVIGQGLKPRVEITVIPKEQVLRNQEILMESMWSCCHVSTLKSSTPQLDPSTAALFRLSSLLSLPEVTEVAARTLGCTLVEVATMDTLYNDVNWPDPEFSKVTLERDLHVWKTVEDHPVLWSILRAASSSRVFLYYCSPVLKSLMAKVVSALEMSRVNNMTDLPHFYERASWLVYILAQGRFIPPPLSSVAELFPYITPYEGYLLLLSVWRYIKENPPALSKEESVEQKCNGNHTQVLRAILNSKIDTMGHLYPRIFNT